MREPLPSHRNTETIKIRVPGLRHSIFITVGYYTDGRPGEVFFSTSALGTNTNDLLLGCALLASIALQHGSNLKEIAMALREMRFGGVPEAIADALLTFGEKQND